jgi:DNA-binding LacI/PurR family transcriptional regulator
MPSIRAVAKEAGVSIATVSRVLNSHASVGGDIRMRVLHAANKLGYISNIGKRATTYLAFAYTGPASFNSPFDGMLIHGITQAMDETDFDLLILNPQRDKRPTETYSQFFMRKGVRGVILRTTASTRSTCLTIAEEAFPLIVVGGRFEQPHISYVFGDSLPTSRQAVEHLISLGHRRIGISMGLIEDSDHADRLEGYRQALANHGIEQDLELVYRIPPSRPDGAQLIKRIMGGPTPPTALYITDPHVVVGAINQAHRLGVRIPDDLSIVGMDDGDSPKDAYPQLTAVCQDAVQIGYEASSALKRLIDADPTDEVSPARIALPTWLEVHETTGPPPSETFRVLPDGTRTQPVDRAV